MKSPYWIRFLVAIALMCQVGMVTGAESVDQLRAAGARVSANAQTGYTRFVGFDTKSLASTPVDATLLKLSAQAAASQHLANYAALFGLRDAASETNVKKHRDESDGRSMTRFQQNYQGIPVIAGELIVNQTAQRQLSSISGRVSPNLKLGITPVVTAQQATSTALEAMTKWHQLPTTEFVVSTPLLSIYDSRLMSPHTEPVALVWQIDVSTKSLHPIKEFIAIDALTGAITLHFNQVPHAKNRLTYDANNTTAVPGTLQCNESNPTCSGGVTDAVYAHRYAGTTYDFYANTLGRDGINGAGLTMISTVRLCVTGYDCPYANAFWNGTQMSYGEGYAVGEDVVAHELTHGVTENESSLYYYYQSGAINESLSDVFGELVQQSNASEPITPLSNRWLMGEKLSIGAIRSMSDPTLYSDPDKITSANYYLSTGDQGGVHINSGVNNKAAYLMVDGGTFNGRTVSALGLTKTAKIYYRVQTSLLTSGSDYLDLHNALYQACQDLIGTSGISSGDCTAVQNATLAVEMNLEPSAGFMPSATMCPAGQSVTSTLFSDGLESGVSNWVFAHTAGSNNWVSTTDYAATGIYSLYGFNPAVTSDLAAAMTNSIALPANAYLWFNHAFGFEGNSTFYDGGVLEYSTNAGGTWNDAGSLFAEGKNYGGTLSSSYGNPLGGHSAFVSVSHGYVSSRYNLASLAGQSVRFRWRVVTDSEVSALGWLVDDVKIHACGIPATPPGPPTNVSVTSYPGRVQISFTAPASSGSSSITGYTASCSASGQTTRSNTGTTSPINISNLTTGVAYSCSVTASNSQATSSASATVAITGPRKVDLTPILMLLLD